MQQAAIKLGKVLSCGYLDNTQCALIDRMMIEHECVIVDIRNVPWSRKQGYKREELRERWNVDGMKAYIWAGAYLGNVNYKDHSKPHILIDPEPGLRGIEALLKRGLHVILLCGCREHDTCHRSDVVALLQQRTPALKVIKGDCH